MKLITQILCFILFSGFSWGCLNNGKEVSYIQEQWVCTDGVEPGTPPVDITIPGFTINDQPIPEQNVNRDCTLEQTTLTRCVCPRDFVGENCENRREFTCNLDKKCEPSEMLSEYFGDLTKQLFSDAPCQAIDRKSDSKLEIEATVACQFVEDVFEGSCNGTVVDFAFQYGTEDVQSTKCQTSFTNINNACTSFDSVTCEIGCYDVVIAERPNLLDCNLSQEQRDSHSNLERVCYPWDSCLEESFVYQFESPNLSLSTQLEPLELIFTAYNFRFLSSYQEFKIGISAETVDGTSPIKLDVSRLIDDDDFWPAGRLYGELRISDWLRKYAYVPFKRVFVDDRSFVAPIYNKTFWERVMDNKLLIIVVSVICLLVVLCIRKGKSYFVSEMQAMHED
eukprot:TRINITY_DN776050_c0_g1_i1.p1 TRINITY_DN776050_c0_g1~~TRINITY_DN776050_c0_g1_i1.p1  ORF type:complete len:394 (-),score=63.74 TRINITY_DN776050_c0_g1_i1:52-1233(-)